MTAAQVKTKGGSVRNDKRERGGLGPGAIIQVMRNLTLRHSGYLHTDAVRIKFSMNESL